MVDLSGSTHDTTPAGDVSWTSLTGVVVKAA